MVTACKHVLNILSPESGSHFLRRVLSLELLPVIMITTCIKYTTGRKRKPLFEESPTTIVFFSFIMVTSCTDLDI